MDRTPIKIPGKRKSKPNVKNKTSASSQPRGRPLKLTPSNKVDRDTSPSSLPAPPAKKRSMKNIKSKKQMSLLEKLPVELLEIIYLFAMDISLPRSSPVIAGKLSRESIYLQTTIEAFQPTWEAFNARTKANYATPSGNPAVVSFQNAILRCRWASAPMLVKAQDMWFESHSRNLSDWPKWFILDDMLDGCDSEWPSELTVEKYFNANFSRFTNFHLMDENHNRFSWVCDFDVDKGVEIPESLLLGPWSEELIKLLFLLVKSGARVDYRYSTSGEVASEGLRNAISAGDVRVIHLLLRAQPDRKLDNLDTLIYALRNAGGNKVQVVNFIMMVVTDHQDRLKEGLCAGIIESEMDELRSKAMKERNRKELDFIDAIIESRWYERLQGRHRYRRKRLH